jgi:hypothetical protein
MESAHALLGSWESFYLIIGTTAGALTGLQFVVMALIADTPGPASADNMNAFGTPTVVHFCLSLVVAVLVSAPWHALAPLAWLIGALGCIGAVYTLIVLRRARRQTIYRPVLEDWIWHTALPMVAYIALISAAAVLPAHAESALFVVAAVVLALVMIGIHNAWDSVVFVTMLRRSKSQD